MVAAAGGIGGTGVFMSDTMEQRKTSLLKELTSYERRDLNFARCHSWSAQISLWLSLAAAGFAALLGLIPALSAHFEKWQLGVASALSAGFTILSRQVGFQRKANLYYRKVGHLGALRRRLQFEQPLSPSPENIAAISSDLSKLESAMAKEWADMQSEPSQKAG
jgi:hypothetical protein